MNAEEKLARLHEMLEEEWNSATDAMYEIDDDEPEYSELLGVRGLIIQIKEFLQDIE